MILNFTARTSLKFALRNTSPAIQNAIESSLNFGRYYSAPNGRVLLFDWTAAYLETTAIVSIANTGVATLTNTVVNPVISFPADSGVSAPTTTMKPFGLEVFLISQPAVAGQSRDPECVVTLSKAGPATICKSSLVATAADEVVHMSWASKQAAAYTTLAFSGIKQHGIRIVAAMFGEA